MVDSQRYEDYVDELERQNEVLRNLLTVYLSHEDKQYIRIKYDIDL